MIKKTQVKKSKHLLFQGSTSSTFFLLTVDVQDINDNSPIFSGTPYYVSVNEVSPVSCLISTLSKLYDI